MMERRRELSPFVPADSDGCSALAFMTMTARTVEAQLAIVIWVFGDDARAAIAACFAHDRRYYLGGSRQDRRRADAELAAAWRSLIGSRWDIRRRLFIAGGWAAVRLFGGPRGKRPGVSWSFGGGLFQYSAAPAMELAG